MLNYTSMSSDETKKALLVKQGLMMEIMMLQTFIDEAKIQLDEASDMYALKKVSEFMKGDIDSAANRMLMVDNEIQSFRKSRK